MRVKHYSGTVVDVPEARAAKLASSGSWTYIDKPAEKPVEDSKYSTGGGDTGEATNEPQRPSEPQEEVKPAATIQEMRVWALKEGIEGVREKGKLARHAIEAYLEAHKED